MNMDFTLGLLAGIALCLDKTAKPFVFQNLFTPDLQAQLQDAIARDDFEEAARLRDLMNKKQP